jgi:hypothetical protein
MKEFKNWHASSLQRQRRLPSAPNTCMFGTPRNNEAGVGGRSESRPSRDTLLPCRSAPLDVITEAATRAAGQAAAHHAMAASREGARSRISIQNLHVMKSDTAASGPAARRSSPSSGRTAHAKYKYSGRTA